MKKYKFRILFSLLAAIAFSACEVVDPMDSEQYQKDIYIVGAYNKVTVFEVPYGDGQDAFISLAVSGTMKIDQDVDVTLERHDDIIDWYNNKYMLDAPVKYQPLDTEYINVPSWTTAIRSGQVYGRLPFTVNSSDLHCDSLYAIGFAIESVLNYHKSRKDTALILTLKLINEFSGNYRLEAEKITLREEELPEGGVQWVESGLPVPVSIQRTLTAVSADTVRFFHEKQKETLSEYSNSWDPGKDYFDAINKYGIKFGKQINTNTFSVVPWSDMNIVDGEATFENNAFTFWYDYIDGTTRYRMKGTFKR